MSRRVLTVDLGNSRAKLRAWSFGQEGRETSEHGTELEVCQRLPERLATWLAACAPCELAVVSSVCDRALEQRVLATLRVHVRTVLDDLDPDLTLELDEPSGVGRDRLFAARGALEVAQSCLVLDAGTALTVDAVLAEPAASVAAGRFLGGAIAPAPGLLAHSLHAGSARLPSIDPPVRAAALGKDTRSAIAAGVVVGFQGAAWRLIEAVGEESGLTNRPVVMSGGGLRYLDPVRERLGERGLVVDGLVSRGLLAALGAGEPRGPRPPAVLPP